MAATIVTRIAGIGARFRKPVAATAIVLSPDGLARFDTTTSPTFSTGAGAPTEAANDGSLYTRTDASDGDDALYLRIGAAWVPIFGATA